MAVVRRSIRNMMSKTGTSGLTTDTSEVFTEVERRVGGLIAGLVVANLTGTAPSITAKIQHSPSPDSVSDANAVWLDLLTFTAITANGSQIQSTAGPYFPRLRAQLTRGGTAVTTLDYNITIC